MIMVVRRPGLSVWLVGVVLGMVACGEARPVSVDAFEVTTREGSQWIDVALEVCNPARLDVRVSETGSEVLIAAFATKPSTDDCAVSSRQRLDEPVGDRVVQMRDTGEVIPVVLEDRE